MATAVQPNRALIEGAAAAVVAGAGPDGFLRGGIELAGDQARHQAAEGGADFVGAGGEVLAHEAYNFARDAGDGRRQLEPVAVVVSAPFGFGFVLPGDAEEVRRVDIPQADVFQAVADGLRDGGWVFLLREGGDGDFAFAAEADGFVEDGLVDFFHGMAALFAIDLSL